MFDASFIFKLISSFIIGGVLIALQVTLAEKANKKLAGLIITFPSTAIVGFYFMWEVLDEDAFKLALAPVPLAMGLSLFFIYAYIKIFQLLTQKIKHNLSRILITTLITLGSWLILAFVILQIKIANIWLSLGIFILIVVLVKLLFSKEELCTKSLPTIHYSFLQKFGRVIFSGSVIALTVFLAKFLGPSWGGVFSMFPAAYLSSLLMYSHNYDHKFMYRIYCNAPIGIIGLLIFTFAVWFSFPLLGNFFGTIISILSSFIYALLLYRKG